MTQRKQRPPSRVPTPSQAKILDHLSLIEQDPEKLLRLYPDLTPDEQLGTLLFAPGDLRQKLLLTTPLAKQLVSMLPVQEAHLTLMEVGIEDATFLLTLMTREQIQFVSDLETWTKDGFSPPRFKKFIQIFRQCGESRLGEWLALLDPEVLVLFLKACGEISKLDLFEDKVEETDPRPFISQDGYYRFHCEDEESRALLEPLLHILHTQSPHRYGMIMESAYQDMTAEVEEQAQQFRIGRLADRGIPDFDGAVEIYRPLEDEQARRLWEGPCPVLRGGTEAAPLYPVRWLPPDSFLRRTLRILSDAPESDQIRMELASLANKVLVADGIEVKDPDTLKYALRKAAGYLTVGLEGVTGGDVKKASEWIRKTWVQDLFRIGYTRVHQLVRSAERLRYRSGFRWIDRTHCLADTPMEETLRGLYLRRPLFFEGITDKNWLGFREFASLQDVQTTAARLDSVDMLSRMFTNMALGPERIKEIALEGGLGDLIDTIKWSGVLHTLWACRTLTGRTEFRLLSLSEMTRFLQISFVSEKEAASKGRDPAYLEDMIEWLLAHDPGATQQQRRLISEWIRTSAARVEQELSSLDPHHMPDPRSISCLYIRSLPSTS